MDLKSTFELTKQIYDEKILSWVPAFLKLDTDDKIRVLERVNTLFDDKNYFTKNKSCNINRIFQKLLLVD